MILATAGEIEIALQYRLLNQLACFDGRKVDLGNYAVLITVLSAISSVLVSIEDDYPLVDREQVQVVDSDGDAKIMIVWWIDENNKQQTTVQFSPLCICEKDNHIKAYERAMSIL